MKTKKMNETSWRTLMLLTTLFIVFVIFQGTVRTPRLPAVKAQPPIVAHPQEDPNTLQDKPAPSQPEPVVAVAEARPVWLNDNLGDLNKVDWSSSSEWDDADESSPPESNDPNESSPPVPE